MVDGLPANEKPVEDKPRNKHVASAIRIVKVILNQWLVIGFGLACLFAYLWPDVAAHGGIIKSEYSVLYGGVGFIFLVSGLQLSPQKIRENLTNWRLHIITQGISFIIIPLIWLALLWIIIAGGDLRTGAVDVSILVGMVVLSCLPTTIASNVVMTRLAGGDDAAAIVEVVIGNVFGSFLCPALIYAFIPSRPEFDPWRPASPSTLGAMYINVAMQLGLSVLVPLIVGQIIRVMFEKQVKWVLEKFYLAKVSTFFLCTLVWSTFSNAFKTGAIYKLPKASILFNVFMNVALYGFFTLVCLYAARPPRVLIRAIESRIASSRIIARIPQSMKRILTLKPIPKEQTVAICFCGAAKTTSVGIPLVTAMWAKQDDLTRAYIQIPVLLYTMEQVFMAQGLVYVFKWYIRRDKKESEIDGSDEEGGSSGIQEDGIFSDARVAGSLDGTGGRITREAKNA